MSDSLPEIADAAVLAERELVALFKKRESLFGNVQKLFENAAEGTQLIKARSRFKGNEIHIDELYKHLKGFWNKDQSIRDAMVAIEDLQENYAKEGAILRGLPDGTNGAEIVKRAESIVQREIAEAAKQAAQRAREATEEAERMAKANRTAAAKANIGTDLAEHFEAHRRLNQSSDRFEKAKTNLPKNPPKALIQAIESGDFLEIQKAIPKYRKGYGELNVALSEYLRAYEGVWRSENRLQSYLDDGHITEELITEVKALAGDKNIHVKGAHEAVMTKLKGITELDEGHMKDACKGATDAIGKLAQELEKATKDVAKEAGKGGVMKWVVGGAVAAAGVLGLAAAFNDRPRQTYAESIRQQMAEQMGRGA